MWSPRRIEVLAALSLLFGVTSPASAKTLIDYFQPMPITGRLTSSAWGAAGVLPRDLGNGLEDSAARRWVYWDGKILRTADGKFHMFASRWAESLGHLGGWPMSAAVHAVSSTPIGPFVDVGLAYPSNMAGKGHNVTADVLPDGRYVILVSETRPGDFFTATSPDGPWTFQGSIVVNANGFDATGTTSNLSFMVRPDGGYEIVSRHGILMISTTGLTGPYEVQGPSVYATVTGIGTAAGNANAEDPLIWYSGGQYHIVYNYWDVRRAYHLTSADGIHNWKNQGLAFDPTTNFLRYTDGTVNHWNNIERPGVLIEDGHVTHFTFAVLDVPKASELGNDNHGSKVIVVPFDGVLFDQETGIATPPTDAGVDGPRDATGAGVVGDAGTIAIDAGSDGSDAATAGSGGAGGAGGMLGGLGGATAAGGARGRGGVGVTHPAPSGCGCAVEASSRASSACAVLLVLGVLVRRRSRR